MDEMQIEFVQYRKGKLLEILLYIFKSRPIFYFISYMAGVAFLGTSVVMLIGKYLQ